MITVSELKDNKLEINYWGGGILPSSEKLSGRGSTVLLE